VDETAATKTVQLAFRSTLMPALGVADVAATELTAELTRPVVAGASDGAFVVSWATWGDDELDIALRKVTPTTGEPEIGDVVFANESTTFSQHSPDILALPGGDFVVAWVDDTAETAPDLRYRLFDEELRPDSSERTLAATEDVEGDVALARFGNGWAAAWRAGSGGFERIQVSAGEVEWWVGPFLAGAANEAPALVEISDHELLVVFTEGTDPLSTSVAKVPRLRAALLDTTNPGEVEPFAVEPRVEPYASEETIGQHSPAVERVGDEVYLAWRSASESEPPAGRAEELWLKPILVTESAGETVLDLLFDEAEIAARPKSRVGDQRAPALLGFELDTEKRLLAAWEDWGKTFGATAAEPEVHYQVTGLPLYRSDRITLRVAFAPSTPAGAQVIVTGPGDFEETVTTGTTFTDLDPGVYAATSNTVRVAGTLVDTLQTASFQNSPVTLVPGDSETITAEYSRIPGTGMAWISNLDHRDVFGFGEGKLSTAGTVTAAPDVVLSLPPLGTGPSTITALAFSDSHELVAAYCDIYSNQVPQVVAFFAAERLAVSGNLTADKVITLPSTNGEYDCPVAMTFDPDGNLWVGFLDFRLLRYTPEQLSETGAPTPVNMSADAFNDINDLAFDSAGNLFVAGYSAPQISILSPAQQATSADPLTPAIILSGFDGPTGFAFEADGDLWVADYDAETVSKLAAADLGSTGSPTPTVVLSGMAGPEHIAFDESGNLWVTSFDANVTYKFAAADLATSGTKTPATTLTANSMFSSTVDIRFNPTPTRP
jgi:sugar lactone lactonase YvrE